MGKENTRTLKNVSYKKPSKKKSRKNSISETEKEMRNILDSASEVYNPGVRNFLGGNNMQTQMPMPQMPMPQMPMPQMPMMPQMPQMPQMPMVPEMPMDGMPMMSQMPMQGMGNQMQMFSPANYDSIMLQNIAPLQTRQAIAPPSGLMDPTSFAHSIASYSRQPGGMIGGGGADMESLPGYGIPAGNLFRIV
jgi:hypothetical protein